MSKRVFHIISHFDLGGAERVAANIAIAGSKDVEYHVVEVMRGSSAYTSQFIAELEGAGVICHRSLIPDIHFHYLVERIAALLFPFRFLWIWLRWHPQVVHTHTETPDLCTFFALKMLPFAKVRVVRTIHNTCLWTGQKKMGYRVEKFLLRQNFNFAISKSVNAAYKKNYGEPRGIIYNGIAEVEQLPYPDLRQGKTNILFAARLEPQKGIKTLVEIIKRMAADERYFFHVHGSGSQGDYVRESLGELKNVEIGEPIFGIARYMASFDYLLMPSEHEGLALTPIEASLAGLPTIINHAEGLYETLPPDWQLTIYNNKVDDYVNLFSNLLPTIDRRKLGDSARQFALANFSLQKMSREYEKAYFQFI